MYGAGTLHKYKASSDYYAGFGNPEVWKQLGFNVNYRWQKDYLWQSSLPTGTVPAYSTEGAQVQ